MYDTHAIYKQPHAGEIPWVCSDGSFAMYGAMTPVSSGAEAEDHPKRQGESECCLGTMYPYSEVGPAVGLTNHKPNPKMESDKAWKPAC